MAFLNFGYYIVEPTPKPDYISLQCDKIISASGCICDFHPLIDGSFWLNHDEKQLEYMSKLKISEDAFNTLKNTVSDLIDKNKLDYNGRFADYVDAAEFYAEYLSNLNGLKIIAIALEGEFKDILRDEIGDSSNILPEFELQQTIGELIGFEILGWDFGSFHSYLCNSFDKDISEAYNLMVNDFGIIQNSYAEVKKFAEFLEDKNGEPVVWLPFAVFECPIKGLQI